MKIVKRWLTPLTNLAVFAALLGLTGLATADVPVVDTELESAEAQLAHSAGLWDVKTDFLNADGTVAKSVKGTYEFEWVVPNRVVSGKNTIPELQQSSGILFYINVKKRLIEMVSVGADGQLWTMRGALGEEVRATEEYETSSGGVAQLRFTRFNVSEDSFESRMEYTEDGGKTWADGNHQYFQRVSP